VTEPRRVLIDWDYGAHGIWWVLTKEEKEEPAPPGQWSEARPSERSHAARPWSGRLTSELLDDLQAWNDDWYHQDLDIRLLRERGRDLAIRVQAELGTDGWEVLYQMDGQMIRVHPPGKWPIGSWQQQLLGYAPRRREPPDRAI
jgi:hypothetical protein